MNGLPRWKENRIRSIFILSWGGHNLYFGLTFNAAAGNFGAGGGGIGLFEDRAVERLIFAFFRHYLWEG